MPTAAPTRLDTPSVVLDTTGTDPVHIVCALRLLDHTGSQEFEDIETFCNPKGEAPGAVAQSWQLEWLQSFGAAGSAAEGAWNRMKPLEGKLVDFAVLLDRTQPLSETNPEMSGQVYVPFIPFISAGVRKYSTLTGEFKIYGEPVYTMTGAPVFADHATI